MADRIHHQIQQLTQTDQLRRELIANVSHDLRTPLTSLQGYLETLSLKEGTLSAEDQRTYLAIATAQSEQLGKLIAELFDLTKLNSQEMRPHLEPFAMNELVQDVVQKITLVAEKKHVRLEAQSPANLPFVSGDIGLIERVLENLIENAIRRSCRTSLIGTIGSATVSMSDRQGPGSVSPLPNAYWSFTAVPSRLTVSSVRGRPFLFICPLHNLPSSRLFLPRRNTSLADKPRRTT